MITQIPTNLFSRMNLGLAAGGLIIGMESVY